MVRGDKCADFLDELNSSMKKQKDTVENITLELRKTNKKVDQLEEKIEKLGTKVNNAQILNEVEVEEKAILVVGGSPNKSKKSVEAITTDGTPLCTLPDLPDDRTGHTMDDHIMCGGYLTQSSCLYYVAGKWTKYRNDLQIERANHVSWRRRDGEVLLIGGETSKNTSEVVSSSGHQKGFNLKHEVNKACAIKVDDYLIITGGFSTTATTTAAVSMYDKTGWLMDLTSLNTGRFNHGCSHFYSDTNELIYLVTGGYNVNRIISTEVMSASGSSWSYVGNLPRAASGMVGISVKNHIYVTGGHGDEVGYLNTILKFNPASKKWEKTGELSFARNHHAVAVLPMKEVKPYCL